MSASMIQRSARALFWLALLFSLAMAVVPVSPELPTNDKTRHIAAFMMLTLLARIGYWQSSSLRLFLWLGAFGGMIELVQGLEIVSRDADPVDWLADLGATAVLLIAIGLYRRKQLAALGD